MWFRHYILFILFYDSSFLFGYSHLYFANEQEEQWGCSCLWLWILFIINGIVFINFTPVLECMGVCVWMHLLAVE